MALAIAIDLILIPDIFFLVLILVSSEFVSFHNEAHPFLKKKYSLKSPIGIL